MKQRPIGVTVLAIIDGLVALFWGLVGISLFFVGPILNQISQDPEMAELVEGIPAELFETLPKVFGSFFIALALLNAVMAIGLWMLYAWAWYLNLGFQALGILSNLGGLLLINPISLAFIAFSGFYIYYFLQQPVQEAFGVRNAF